MNISETAQAAPGLEGGPRLLAELITLGYISSIALLAGATGMFYMLFPELGALSQDIFTRPEGTWSRSPGLLAVTPVLTAAVGTLAARHLEYGWPSVLITVGAAIAIIMILRSPVAPAISAGLLPLVLGVKDWTYVPAIAVGTVLLAILSMGWRRLSASRQWALRRSPAADVVETAPHGYAWLAALMLFVATAVLCVEVTGLRFLLFPPLVVIGFEMLGHPRECPWADRLGLLPVACFLTAAGGLFFTKMLGVGAPAAALSMAWGIAVLRSLKLHVPPALAVALLPLVMDRPGIAYPFAVLLGTTLLTAWFAAYRHLAPRILGASEGSATPTHVPGTSGHTWGMVARNPKVP
jgi:hypothetical protein